MSSTTSTKLYFIVFPLCPLQDFFYGTLQALDKPWTYDCNVLGNELLLLPFPLTFRFCIFKFSCWCIRGAMEFFSNEDTVAHLTPHPKEWTLILKKKYSCYVKSCKAMQGARMCCVYSISSSNVPVYDPITLITTEKPFKNILLLLYVTLAAY